MMKIVQGDVTKATENIIVHQVNCQAKMGSGVALGIRNAFPSAYQDYIQFSLRKNPKELLGQVYISVVGKDKYVTHLFGQLNYGYDRKRYTSYDAFYDGLSYVKKHAQSANMSVAMPYGIGSARGGADWEIIQKMIERIFHDYEVTLYQYGE